jgi:hypothetical protein
MAEYFLIVVAFNNRDTEDFGEMAQVSNGCRFPPMPGYDNLETMKPPRRPMSHTSLGRGSPVGPPPDIPEWLEEVRLAVEHQAPLLQALLKRAINAVLEFTALSENAIANATQAPTNLAVLLRALSSGELLEDLRKAEPLAPAFIRGIEASRRLIDEHGGALKAQRVADNFGITPQAVAKRRREGKLIAITAGRHGHRYPVWQFTASGVLPGLEDALKALAPHDEWMQIAFFVSKNTHLGNRTPIELLKAGKLDLVLNAAEIYGEHGAE